MILQGIDPGKSAAYAYGDTDYLVDPPDGCRVPLACRRPLVTYVSPTSLGGSPARVLVEAQYPKPKSSRQSLITLAFDAGLRLGEFLDGSECYAAKPGQWKPILWPGTLEKEVFCARIRANLHPNELELLRVFDEDSEFDALDSIGIMWALHIASEKDRKAWRIVR